MPYDEHLADRINIQLEQSKANFYAKKMFGGICFMVEDKMCVGVVNDTLMIRIDPEEEAKLKATEGVQDMTFTGRPMKGYLYVSPDAIDQDSDLLFFLNKALEFNPKAKASKKRKKKN